MALDLLGRKMPLDTASKQPPDTPASAGTGNVATSSSNSSSAAVAAAAAATTTTTPSMAGGSSSMTLGTVGGTSTVNASTIASALTGKQSNAKRSLKLSSLADDLKPIGLAAGSGEEPFRARLHDLFSQIEKEFEVLYFENVALREKLDAIAGTPRDSMIDEKVPMQDTFEVDGAINKSFKSKLGSAGSKVKAGHKLRAQTSRIVSSFKAQSVVSSMVREFCGHKDGVWQVSTKVGQPIIGTASADHTACIWGIDTGRRLLQYQGHSGSVNSIRFHPTRDIVLTGSGDATAHIWQAAVNWEVPARKGHSSEEELEDEDEPYIERERTDLLRTPLCEFSGQGGHTSVVVAADWLPGCDQIITGSWDRTAILWDVETRQPLHTLAGHDDELTTTTAHISHRLVVTTSRDSTFRLWDFRDQTPAVSVFQGHTENVTSTVFTRDDKLVSGSDDRSVKIWELRNMRSALTTIRSDSAVNRVAVSASGVIAIPHDNRHIRLFDLNGQRIARLPRTSRQGHRRMVSSVAWTESISSTCNLFSCGFDRRVLGWCVSLPPKDN
ncbi:WD repeat-containing protein 37 [Anopheles aquasalis]|uniref:WD repeat-containing protein 37 n=1 Tax=Anopheles aquasalis TaxID=42839 RepID=UPI00215AAF60|nr:WD repeat-containing protein 37 [Anopheles aquasalis]